MAETRRLRELVARIEPRVELPEGDLVVALSGGPDSAALAYLAVSAGRAARLLHVDHGLAGSGVMRAAAEGVASALGRALEVVEVSVDPGPSVEAQARAARYRAFSARTSSSEALLTAHTRDDQAETVLLNLLRGSGLRGMAGIPPHRSPNTYRPLLDVTRSETRELATLAGLPFGDDPMNLDVSLRRNSIRLQVLPSLRRFNAQLTDSLARLAVAARKDSDLIDGLAAEVEVRRGENLVGCAVGNLAAVGPVIAGRVVSRMVAAVRGTGPTAAELDRISRVLEGSVASDQITPRVSVERRGPMLVLDATAHPPPPPEEVPIGPGTHRVGDLVLEVERSQSVCRVAPIGSASALFPDDATLVASVGAGGEVMVSADGELAWTVGVKRHPVAFYEPGATGYLVVTATEESGPWTSSL